MFDLTIDEQHIFGKMIEYILLADTNKDFLEIYNTFKAQYDWIKNFSLAIGTNDDIGLNFHTNILSELNSKNFYDHDGNEVVVKHHFSNYRNVLYLTDTFKQKVVIDGSVFVDSNSMNMFETFHNTKKINEFIDFKFTHQVDLNYLPYMMEDYVNPHHIRKNPKRTLEKIRVFEIINHLDVQRYRITGELVENFNLLQEHSFSNIEELIDERIFYFNHFIDRSKEKLEPIYNADETSFTYCSKNKFDVYSLLSEYYLIYGYLLNILIEKRKNSTTNEKTKNVLHNMVLNGRLFKNMLEFAYDCFENETKVNQFFNYDNTWDYNKVIAETYNKAWDIFLYSLSEKYLTNTNRQINGQKPDLGIAFFLTKDNKFYKSYVEGYLKKVFIINESIHGRPFVGLNEQTERSQQVEEMIQDYYNRDFDNLIKLKNMREQLIHKKKMYSMALIFKERMTHELKRIMK